MGTGKIRKIETVLGGGRTDAGNVPSRWTGYPGPARFFLNQDLYIESSVLYLPLRGDIIAIHFNSNIIGMDSSLYYHTQIKRLHRLYVGKQQDDGKGEA